MISLQNIFINKLKDDNRVPIILMESNTTIALLLPNLDFWIQVTVLYIIQSVFGLILSAMIYKLIIQNRISLFYNKDSKNNSVRFIIGYGVIIPIAIMLPYNIIDYFNIENKTIQFSLMCLPNAIVFRCLEAMVRNNFHDFEFVCSNILQSITAHLPL